MYKSNIRNQKSRSGKHEKKRDVIYPEDGQEFAFVQDMLGNGRLKAYCEDGTVRVGRIRGSMRKFKQKVIIQSGDIILISRRDFEDDKVDVIHKYSLEEANQLHYQGEFPEKIAKVYQTKDDINSHQADAEEHNYIAFANVDTDQEDDKEDNKEEEEIDIDAI